MREPTRWIAEQRRTPVRLECYVLVAGAGTAGCVAALAAARRGVSTVLVERHGFPGGTMINGAGPLHSFFNLWKETPGGVRRQLVRGIPQQIVDRLVAVGGSYGHVEQERGTWYDSVATIIDPEAFKHVMLQMLEEAGVKVLLHTWIADVVMEDRSLRGVFVESKAGREALLARTVVDCTGDGDVAARAGVPCVNTYPDSAVGMPFGMYGVDLSRAVAFFDARGLVTQLARAGDGGGEIIRVGFDLRKLPVFRQFMEPAGMWGPMGFSRGQWMFNHINTANLKPLDALDPAELSRAERVLREQVFGIARLLRSHVPGFERAAVTWTTVQVGVRRTRIVSCEYDLSPADVLEGRRFDDEIALYGFHDCAPRRKVGGDGAYGIPYRCLVPKEVDNLLVAGRMITSDWETHMSTRNTVSCMAQGQAAGTAAALACQEGVSPRLLDVAALRAALREDGVYLGDPRPGGTVTL